MRVLLAQRRLASLTASPMTTHASASTEVKRPLHQLLGPGPCGGAVVDAAAHRPDSSAAFSTRTCRNRAAGEPWLTGATWPGCPLPQLKAPPST